MEGQVQDSSGCSVTALGFPFDPITVKVFIRESSDTNPFLLITYMQYIDAFCKNISVLSTSHLTASFIKSN